MLEEQTKPKRPSDAEIVQAIEIVGQQLVGALTSLIVIGRAIGMPAIQDELAAHVKSGDEHPEDKGNA